MWLHKVVFPDAEPPETPTNIGEKYVSSFSRSYEIFLFLIYLIKLIDDKIL